MNHSPSLVGSALKAIASTPNRNFDNESYRIGVIEPAARIRSLDRDFSVQPLSTREVAEVVSLLRNILQAKQLPAEELRGRMLEILKAHDLLHLDTEFQR